MLYHMLDDLFGPLNEEMNSECGAYGSEFLNDNLRMVDQPMQRESALGLPLDDLIQLGQVRYVLVADPEVGKPASESTLPYPWNQFKLYARAQSV